MNFKKLIPALVLIFTVTGFLVGISLYLQPNQSIIGIAVIIGSALLGAAAFISGLNDSYDILQKLKKERSKIVPTKSNQLPQHDFDQLQNPISNNSNLLFPSVEEEFIFEDQLKNALSSIHSHLLTLSSKRDTLENIRSLLSNEFDEKRLSIILNLLIDKKFIIQVSGGRFELTQKGKKELYNQE